MSSPRRIFTATLVIGVSGAGKTSLLKTFAEYLWETHQKVLMLYSWDGGAIPNELQKRIQQGLIRFWRVRTRSGAGLALETLYLATKGYLPESIDPLTGETAPDVRLVAPLQVTYEASCPKGHPLITTQAQSLLVPTICTACGNQMISRNEMILKTSSQRTKGFELIGGVAYDGITSMCQIVMDHMDRARGDGTIGGEKSAFGGIVKSGDVSFGGNNRADVGFAQTRAQQFVNNTLSIPGLVESPVFTGLSTEGESQGLSVVGLNLPGQAALSQAPQWFGNIMEASSRLDTEGKKHFVLHLRPFIDKEGRYHLLKTSSSPFGLPDLLEDPAVDDRQAFQGFNLGRVFKLLDEDLAASLAEQEEGLPGMPDGLLTYGETTPLPTPSVSPSAGPVAAGPRPVTPMPAGSGAPPTSPRRPPPAAVPSMNAAPPPPGPKPPARAPGSN